MHLFRSEEHVDAWLVKSGIARGESFTIAQGWQLARDLYADRLSADWKRKTTAEYRAMFVGAGLHSDFWTLTT